jgi:hypothetical protein
MTATQPVAPCLLLLVASLMAVPASAHDVLETSCRDGIEATLRRALASDAATASASQGELRELDCVALGNGDLVALANFVEVGPGSPAEGNETYTVVLAALDAEGREVRRQQIGVTSSDAMVEFRGENFRLEAAWDDTAPEGGAIGVAVDTSAIGPSAPDVVASDEFAVLVPEGAGFRRVLHLARQTEVSIEGCVSPWCKGSHWASTTSTLTPGERDADGWRRITMRMDVMEVAMEPAVAQTEPTSTTTALSYRDGSYRLPDGLLPHGSEYFVLLPW